MPPDWADGIAVGSYLEYDAERGKTPRSLCKVVYSDKTKKKLVNWYGFGL